MKGFFCVDRLEATEQTLVSARLVHAKQSIVSHPGDPRWKVIQGLDSIISKRWPPDCADCTVQDISEEYRYTGRGQDAVKIVNME